MLKRLKGSEKQIAWAEKIREDRMSDFYYWQKLFLEKAQNNNDEEQRAKIKKYTELLENIEEAEKWIRIEKAMLSISLLPNKERREKALEGFKAYGIF
jgi:hypothetical protein